MGYDSLALEDQGVGPQWACTMLCPLHATRRRSWARLSLRLCLCDLQMASLCLGTSLVHKQLVGKWVLVRNAAS